jgi:hypothetical protein
MLHVRAATPELFTIELGSDPMYNDVRNPTPDAPEPLAAGRDFAERLWRRTAAYLDADLPVKAAQHFHQAFSMGPIRAQNRQRLRTVCGG